MQTITINFDEVPATRLNYKYDLMHMNTPSYASTLIEWDTGKMGKISRNRVLRWLKGGIQTYNTGEAADVYRELIRQLNIPRVKINNELLRKTSKDYCVSSVGLQSPTDDLIEALEEVYQASRVLAKMQGMSPYHFSYESVRAYLEARGEGYFAHISLVVGVPMDKVLAAIDRMVSTDEYKAKIADAVEFIEQGKKLYFKYN